MDNQNINNLREALKVSPDNTPLRLHLAQTLLEAKRYDEAEEEFQIVLSKEDNQVAKFGLATIFFAKGAYSKCNVIVEELLKSNETNIDLLLLHTRALVKENDIPQAIDVYKRILDIYPDFQDDELDNALRMTPNVPDAMPFDDEDFEFFQRADINFDHVGGMDDVKKEIDLKIIQPLKHPEIYKAYGKKIGGGILLYGPPGCGKTHLAKATAGQIESGFMSVGLNDILDMWIGNSEKNLHEIFEMARENTPCVVFFDEIDALGASRSDMKQSAGRHLINQFLHELDGMDADNEGVLILGATNTPWHLDQAFRRPGRFDRIIFVPPPDAAARKAIFKIKLKDKPTGKIDFDVLAKKTKDYSGADIEAVIDITIESLLEDAIQSGVPEPITTKALLKAIKKHKPTTKEWFATAKNFALYANDSGLYDDILDYLKIKK